MKEDALQPFTQKVQEIQQRIDALESQSKFIQNQASVWIQYNLHDLAPIKFGTFPVALRTIIDSKSQKDSQYVCVTIFFGADYSSNCSNKK